MSEKRTTADQGGEIRYAKRSRIDPYHNASSHSPENYTVAWICALPLELSVSRAMLDEDHATLCRFPNDDNSYTLGRIGQHNVVMACLPGLYGNNNAAIVATDLMRTFTEVQCIFMVGIAGGCPGRNDIFLGDVVVGTRVMQYDLGKVLHTGSFEPASLVTTPNRMLNSAISSFRSDLQVHCGARIANLVQNRLPNVQRPEQPDQLFQASYPHLDGAPTCDNCDLTQLKCRQARRTAEPEVHYGVIASGNKVVKNGIERDQIAERHEALCIEMEAAGVMGRHQCLPVRGICDYADSHKNKAWQEYAAANAAAYTRDFILEALRPPRQEPSRTGTHFEATNVDAANNECAQRRRQLLESLRFPQIDARRTNITPAYKKTCQWLLQQPGYLDWQNPSKQIENHGFFWLRGKAGAGKSTMMKFLFSETKKTSRGQHAATASFFFHARGGDLEKSITGMYRSILLQILESYEDLQSVFDDSDILPFSQEGCPSLNVLKELFRSAVSRLGSRSFTLFVDALDECDEQEVRDMVNYFEDLIESTTEQGICFKICFSSRPYPHIEVDRAILTTLETEHGHSEDLEKYVDGHLKLRNHSVRNDLKARILEKAGGIFLWIVLVINILNEEGSRGSLTLRKKFDEIPAKLSDLFKSILQHDKERPTELLLCILWVLCAKRPLSPSEFQHALWVGLLEKDLVDSELPSNADEDVSDLIISASKGLVEIARSKESTVQFIHQSVPDFLIKERGLFDVWPGAPSRNWEASAHEMLRSCCDTYLSFPDIASFIASDSISHPHSLTMMLEQYPFLSYASQKVLDHADVAQSSIPQNEFLSRFFNSNGVDFLNLFEKFQSRRYSRDAPTVYILADRGLTELIHAQPKETYGNATRERYRYPLFAALANGHSNTTAALLGLSSTFSNSPDITKDFKRRQDIRGYKRRTPMTWAAYEGQLDIVKALIQHGAKVNEVDGTGSKALRRAVREGHTDIVQLLISNGAIWSDVDGYDLRLAAASGYKEIVGILLENGADINAGLGVSSTALQDASRLGRVEVVKILLEKEADMNAQSTAWETALYLASGNGHKEVVEILLENGADINTEVGVSGTALHVASRNGYIEVIKILLGNGADINTQSLAWGAALHSASIMGHKEVVEILLANGADIHAQHEGRNALQLAEERGHKEVVEILLRNGAF